MLTNSRNYPCRFWLIFPAIFLAACVSAPDRQTVPVVESDPIPERGASSYPASRAVADLVIDSQREFERGHWQAAIAVAERALRIDRRQPGVYLLIAKSYRALGQEDQAKQFVQQGLRYLSEDDSPVARELNWLQQTMP